VGAFSSATARPARAATVRVLIVDDSPTIRREFARLLSRDPEIEVVGSAADAYEARDRIVELQPDVVTLDIEMPRMDGLTFLDKLMRYRPLPVVIVSSLTERGGQRAMEAFDAGATEVVSKPGPGYPIADMAQDLAHAVKAASGAARAARPSAPLPAAVGPARLVTPPGLLRQVIAVGASTGGTQAIESVLRLMPLDGPPIVIVQHMPPVFTRSFADRLASTTGLDVREATSGDELCPGRVLIAPGGKHLRLQGGAARRVDVAEGPKVSGHCPSVDVLFDSVAPLGRRAVGVILTGMGSDGARGMLAMKQSGAITLAQSAEGCVVFGMPKAAIDLGAADEVVALGLLPPRILAAAARR
jgi:two-component system chemotaxis response regulator CheB